MMNYAHVLILLSLFGVLNNSLQAGPVYAAQWKRGNQDVFLYGDYHYTHRTIADGSDEKLTDELYNVLAQAPKNTLVLLEDLNNDPWTHDLYCEHLKYAEFEGGSLYGSFLPTINFWLRHDNKSLLNHLIVRSIDIRSEVDLFITACGSFKALGENGNKIKSLKDKGEDASFFIDWDTKVYDHWKRLIKQIPNSKIMAIFLGQITQLRDYAGRASDAGVKNIILEKAHLIEERKKIIEQALENLGSSKQEIQDLTVDDIFKKATVDHCYDYVELFLTLDPLHWYCAEALDAAALAFVTQEQYQHKKVVIVAGDVHIQNLEKDLKELGFQQVQAKGAHLLFDEELLALRRDRIKVFESELLGIKVTQEQYRRAILFEEKMLQIPKSMKLVSSDAFKWIL